VKKRLFFGLAMLVALPLSVQQPAPASAQAQRDWTRVVARTPQGGVRMGNPDAPVKIVEYLSLTCPHCAHFAEEGVPRLVQSYVRNGRVSLEYRNFVLNGYDLAATFLSRCADPENYFALNHAILASQEQWVGRVEALSAEQRRQLQQLQPIEGMKRVVALAGLDALAARHGISAAEARACLSDQAALDRIIEIRTAAEELGVNGTPSFVINGRLAGHVHDWAALEPLLRQAL
jgi:protein-disulfide isomerase